MYGEIDLHDDGSTVWLPPTLEGERDLLVSLFCRPGEDSWVTVRGNEYDVTTGAVAASALVSGF